MTEPPPKKKPPKPPPMTRKPPVRFVDTKGWVDEDGNPVKHMTRDEWVQRALQARIDQGFPVEIEDEATLDFLADVFTRAERSTFQHTAGGKSQ